MCDFTSASEDFRRQSLSQCLNIFNVRAFLTVKLFCKTNQVNDLSKQASQNNLHNYYNILKKSNFHVPNKAIHSNKAQKHAIKNGWK